MKIVHQHVGGELLDPRAGDPFRFAARGSLSQALEAAGFREVEESERTVPWTWRGTAEEVFEYAAAASIPFRAMVDRVPAERWPALRAQIYSAINQYRPG